MSSRPHGSKDLWLDALRTDGPAFAAAVAEAPPDTPVLSCPGWSVTDLTNHLALVYRWIGSFAGSGVTTAPPPRDSLSVPDGEPLKLWQQAYDELVGVFTEVDPEAPAWHWAPQPKQAAFWLRRVAIETAVHRWDAQLAIAAGEPIESRLAADGVSEAMDTLLPAGRGKSTGSHLGVVHVVAPDVEQEWYVRLRGQGVALLDTDTILDTDDHHTRAEISGTASDLLLALWGRIGFDMLEVAGDQSLLAGLRVG